MPAMVCDICGGRLVIGAGGTATCESCGTVYSPERLKEKAMEITGTVQIDSSNMVGNWMKLAETDEDSQNYSEANQYYSKILEVDPDCWKAILGKAVVTSPNDYEGTEGTNFKYIQDAIHRCLTLINSEEISVDEKRDELEYLAGKLKNKCADWISIASYPLKSPGTLGDRQYFIWAPKYAIPAVEETIENLQQVDANHFDPIIFEFKKQICKMLWAYCATIICYPEELGYSAEEKRPYVEKYRRLLKEVREVEPDFATGVYEQIDPWDPTPYGEKIDVKRYEKIYAYWQKQEAIEKKQKEEQIQKEKADSYWKDHADEKQQLDEKMNTARQALEELNSNKKELQQKIHEAQVAIQRLNLDEKRRCQKDSLAKMNALESQKKQFGVFQVKQRKELQDRYDLLNKNYQRFQGELAVLEPQEAESLNLISNFKTEITSLDARIQNMNLQIEKLQEQIDFPTKEEEEKQELANMSFEEMLDKSYK